MIQHVVSGHQPVYLPWLGLYHKLYLCDSFVFMDTVQYLDRSWNNRNKIRESQGWLWLTVPIDHQASQGRMLDQIILRGHDSPDAKDFWQRKHWAAIAANYKKTPYFDFHAPELEKMYLGAPWIRLIDLCWHQFNLFKSWLGLNDRHIIRMSEVEFSGKKDALVLDHCRRLGGDAVVFGSHGEEYVRMDLFRDADISVHFQNYVHPVYQQRFRGFEPYMTVLDLLMNYGPENSLPILLEGNVTYDQLRNDNLWA